MQIAGFRSDHLNGLFATYGQTAARLPHCRFVPSREAFGKALNQAVRAGMELFVAEDSGGALGIGALTTLPGDERVPTRTAITALFATDEFVGAALVDACLERARSFGRPIRAFPDEHNCCPISAYNAGWSGLSDGLPIVARLLARAGFTPYHRELHLSLADCRAVGQPAAPPPGTILQVSQSKHNPTERRWRALRDGVEVGICIVSSVAHLTDDPAAARWGYVQGLGVDEPHRRQGIARWLMTTALADLAKEGYAGCWLTTGATNWGAQRLYLSLGFEVVDASTCFSYVTEAR